MKHTRHVSRTPQLIPAESLLVLRQQIAAWEDLVNVFGVMVEVGAAIIDAAGDWLSLFRDATGKDQE